MYSLRDLFKLRGHRVHVVTGEGEYEGIVKSFHATMDQVTLEKVVIMPKGDPVGTLHFFMFELKSCKVVQEPKDVQKKKSSQNESKCLVSNIVDYKTLTVDVQALKQRDNLGFISTRRENALPDFSDYFADSDDTNVEKELPEEEEEEEFILSLPKYLGSNLPLDWLVISEINDDFFKAIEHINQESVIAVSFEGKSIGRSGKLSLIGISTRYCTFLFDILVLQTEAFEKGLKNVFENPRLQKVIHDCRQPSDALFHLYRTNLVNVFDLQVADVFVGLHKSVNGKVHSNVSTLSQCICRYLNLREQDIYPDEVDHHALKEAIDWLQRPVNNAMKEVAIKNVILLRELRSVLLELMLLSYTQAVDVYLRVLRNATAEELELNPSSPNLLPEALLMNGLHAIHCREFSEGPVFPLSTSALCKNSENELFDFVLYNHSKEVTPKRNLTVPSIPQKKRRSASNRPLRQRSSPLSSEDEEIVSNEKRKPKRLSNRLLQSMKSEEMADAVDKEEMCTFQEKLMPDNTGFEKISHISDLTLKEHHSQFPSTAGDCLRCVYPTRDNGPSSQLTCHSFEPNFLQPVIMQELNHKLPDTSVSKLLLNKAFSSPAVEVKYNDKCKSQVASRNSCSELVLDSVENSSMPSEVNLDDQLEPSRHSACHSDFQDSRKQQVAIKSKDNSFEHGAVLNHHAKKMKIRYLPAGMLS